MSSQKLQQERHVAAKKVAEHADRMRRDIGLIGRLTEQELFDRRRPINYPPRATVMLFTGTYPVGHSYLAMTIDQLLDEDFVRLNSHSIPACWQHQVNN